MSSADPDFEGRKESFIVAARSTCSIGVRRHTVSYGEFVSGTAFFVGPRTLLTAGHVVHDSRDKIIAEVPGVRKATYMVQNLFAEPQAGSPEHFECKLVKTLFGKVDKADISVLEVVGPYTSTSFVEVKQPCLPYECDGIVDIVAYTGAYSPTDVWRTHPSPGFVNADTVHDIEALFPKRELVITHGSITHGGHLPWYAVSTVIGMSGGPVIMSGKVIGTSLRSSHLIYFRHSHRN